MCYMINFIAYKDISKDEIREYSKYGIGITDNTSRDVGDYEEIEHNVHEYIDKTRQIRISLDDFLHTFLTKRFKAEDVVYVVCA